jgi:hypothetical protein
VRGRISLSLYPALSRSTSECECVGDGQLSNEAAVMMMKRSRRRLMKMLKNTQTPFCKHLAADRKRRWTKKRGRGRGRAGSVRGRGNNACDCCRIGLFSMCYKARKCGLCSFETLQTATLSVRAASEPSRFLFKRVLDRRADARGADDEL